MKKLVLFLFLSLSTLRVFATDFTITVDVSESSLLNLITNSASSVYAAINNLIDTKIAAIPAPVTKNMNVYRSSDNVLLGKYTIIDGGPAVLSSKGISVASAIPLGFTTNDCTGQAYMINSPTTGVYYNINGTFYLTYGQSISLTLNSRFLSDGSCSIFVYTSSGSLMASSEPNPSDLADLTVPYYFKYE